MLDRLQDYFYSEPGRITGLGRLLANLGAFLLLARVIGYVATSTANILPMLAKQPETTKALVDLYPGLPLWWVPETWMATAAVAVLVVAGFCFVAHGKMIDRILKA